MIQDRRERRERLVGWKAIGMFVGRDARTMRRWEVERGLPVHRAPGGARSTVWADRAELSQWMAGTVPKAPPPLSSGAASVGRALWPGDWRIRSLATGATALAACVALAVTVHVARPGAPASAAIAEPYADDSVARSNYLDGLYAFNMRTPAGLRHAIDAFGRVIARAPRRADAYVGLADSYNLLREFGGMPEEEAYTHARLAAEHALAIDPDLAGAHRSLAFVRFWHDGDVSALDEFARAVALAPRSAQAHHWYANALAAQARWPEALREMAAARALDPGSTAIIADEAVLRLDLGDFATAGRMLDQLAALEPDAPGPHRYLATLHLLQRDADGFLREAMLGARLRGENGRLVELEQASRETGPGDFPALMRALAERARKDETNGRHDSLPVAVYLALAGDRAEALRWLAAPGRLRASDLVVMPGDAGCQVLRGHPAFKALFRRRSA